MAAGVTHKVGRIEIIALDDGRMSAAGALYPDWDDGKAKEAAAQAGIAFDGGTFDIPISAFALRVGGRLALVDTGSPPGFADRAGHFPEALARAGIAPREVRHLVMTHLHIDHVGGLVDVEGRAVFPNAELAHGAGDWAFFHSPEVEARANPRALQTLMTTRACIAPYAGQRHEVAGETEVLPGVTMIPLPGHTPGHAGILVEDGGEQLLIWGDTIHAEAFQLAQPDWGVAFDTDIDRARDSRKAIFDRVATDGIRVAGPHLAGGGFGRLERMEQGYRLIRDS